MGLRLREDIAVDMLHLMGGGGSGEDHGPADPGPVQDFQQLARAAIVVGGLGQVEVLRRGDCSLGGDLLRKNMGVHIDDFHGTFLLHGGFAMSIAHLKASIK